MDDGTSYVQTVGAFETPKDAGKGEEGQVNLWMQAYELQSKEEDGWRQEASRVIQIYRGGFGNQSPSNLNLESYKYNILYSNTDTLAPALFNSDPVPDIRRRFGDPDKVAKIGALVLERCISYSVDQYDFNSSMRAAIKDVLLPGRGVTRVRYKPYMETRNRRVSVIKGEDGYKTADGESLDRMAMGTPKSPEAEEQGGIAPQAQTAPEIKQDDSGSYIDGEAYEAVSYEETYCEHVQWGAFRRGPGKTWDEVPWISFDHYLTRDEVKKLSPQIGATIPMDSSINPDSQGNQGYQTPEPDIFKRLKVIEFWDKGTNKVYFIAPSYKNGPLKVVDDPLNLAGFFPIPRPLYAVHTPETLIPVPPFHLYKALADELDLVTRRLTALTKVMKWRGVYAVAPDGANYLDQLKNADDGDLVPAQGAFSFAQQGGIENFIWLMPLEELSRVIMQMTERQQVLKENIYEITGISDIMRGSTQASETATAQNVKAQWGSLRLEQMQGDVQRYARDLFRMQGEIIAEKFSPETMALMTGIELPMSKEAFVTQMQAQGAPPEAIQQQMADLVTWEDVVKLLRNDAKRSFRIDIETDSTIQADTQRFQRNIAEFAGAIGPMATGLVAMTESGMLPPGVGVTFMQALARGFKLPRQAMDALDEAGQNPPQPNDGEQQAEAMKAQAEQARTQADIQKTQIDGQIAQQKAQSDAQRMQQEAQLAAQKGQMELIKMQREMERDEREHMFKMEEMNVAHEQKMAQLAAQKAMPKSESRVQ